MRSKIFSVPALLIIAVAATIASCSKDDSVNTPPPAPAGARLEQVTLGDELLRFSYNNDGSIREAVVKDHIATGGDETRFTLQYNNQGRIGRVSSSDGRELVPIYENGEMTRAEIRGPGNALFGYTDYEYLNGRLKSATLVFINGGETQPWMKFIYNYNAAGNVTRTSLFFNDFLNNQLVPAGFIQYDYDDRPSPLMPAQEFLKLIWQAATPNNVIRETHVSQNNTTDEILEYAYSYNSRNLPARATVQRTVPGSAPQRLEMSFTYR